MALKIQHTAIPQGHGFTNEVLASLEDGKASMFALPVGKSGGSIRTGLLNGAKKRGFKVSVSIRGDVVKVWKHAEQAA